MDANILKNLSALNPKIAHQIMDMMDERERIKVDEFDPSKYKFSIDSLHDLLDDKIDYIICDDWIDPTIAQLCADEAKQLYLNKEMIETGIGKDSTLKHDSNVRTDVRKWITSISNDSNPSSLKNLVLQLLSIQEEVNSYQCNEPIKLDGFEIQCAMYSNKGDFYLPHKDAFKIDKYNLAPGQKNEEKRDSSAISNIKGNGELRIHLNDKIIDVVPRTGRCLIFKSEKILHEVRPCNFERFAVSIWFHQTYMKSLLTSEIEEEKSSLEMDLDSTIFVSIPSYRDSQLARTIESLYQNAENPNRIYVGVYLQINRESDHDCNIDELIRLNNAYYARARAQDLYDGQEFYLQIDSHTILAKNWDSQFINWLKQSESYEEDTICILSCYPSGYTLKNEDKMQNNPVAMCFKEFDSNELPTFKSRLIKRSKYFVNPFKSLFYAAGFVFGRSTHLLNETTKYSKSIEYLFTGEEIYQQFKLYKYCQSLHCKLRIYSPPKSIIFHLWSRSYRPTFKKDCNDIMESDALDTIKEKEKAVIHSILEEIRNLNTEAIKICSDSPVENQLQLDESNKESQKDAKTDLSFNEYLKSECGIDIINKQIVNSDLAFTCGLDVEFFK